jgi:hypothetical protein
VTVEVAASGVSMGQAHFDICTQVREKDRHIRYIDMMADRGDKKEDSERGRAPKGIICFPCCYIQHRTLIAVTNSYPLLCNCLCDCVVIDGCDVSARQGGARDPPH